jgi:hypothetical protein
MIQGTEKPINEYDTQTFPNDNYKRLFVAVSQTNGMPTIEDLKGIVEIVKKDFPEPINNY